MTRPIGVAMTASSPSHRNAGRLEGDASRGDDASSRSSGGAGVERRDAVATIRTTGRRRAARPTTYVTDDQQPAGSRARLRALASAPGESGGAIEPVTRALAGASGTQ